MYWLGVSARGTRAGLVKTRPAGSGASTGAGLGGDLGADDCLADKFVDRIHHCAGIGKVFRLEMLRQCVEALAGPPRAHECLCEFVDCGLVHASLPAAMLVHRQRNVIVPSMA